jgi:hypothetical protein
LESDIHLLVEFSRYSVAAVPDGLQSFATMNIARTSGKADNVRIAKTRHEEIMT